jgi:hypothetical protein
MDHGSKYEINDTNALDNILLLRPGQVSPLISSIFNEFCLKSIQIEVQKICGIEHMDIPTDTKTSIENILKVGKFILCTYQLLSIFYHLLGSQKTHGDNGKSC